jgi:hypothetical protein
MSCASENVRANSASGRIQVENATDYVDLRHVGMPGDDDVDAGAGIDLPSSGRAERRSTFPPGARVSVGILLGPLAAVAVTGAIRRSASMIVSSVDEAVQAIPDFVSLRIWRQLSDGKDRRCPNAAQFCRTIDTGSCKRDGCPKV